MSTPKMEVDLLSQFLASRDPALREQLIINHLPLVHFVLGRLGISRTISSDYEDLESQGLLGLIEAIDHYNPNFGTQLSTYATLKIRSKVLDYLRSLDWLPRRARERVRNLQHAIEQLERNLNRLPTDDELAEFLQVDVDEVQQSQMDSSRVVISLDQDRFTSDTEGRASLYESLIDEAQANPSEEYEDKDVRKSMVHALKVLPEREQTVLSLYYFDELTFKEIGKVLDISESRVCQIHGRAMTDIRAILEGNQKRSNRGRPFGGETPSKPITVHSS